MHSTQNKNKANSNQIKIKPSKQKTKGTDNCSSGSSKPETDRELWTAIQKLMDRDLQDFPNRLQKFKQFFAHTH